MLNDSVTGLLSLAWPFWFLSFFHYRAAHPVVGARVALPDSVVAGQPHSLQRGEPVGRNVKRPWGVILFTVCSALLGGSGVVAAQVHSIGGQIRYYSSNAPVSDVQVELQGTVSTSTLTDATGHYSFSGLPVGDYRVLPSRVGGRANGVSALDAAFALQDVVHLRTLDANQTLACDVTGNGSISALDSARILQLVVTLIPRLPAAQTCGSDWLFLPSPPGAVTPVLTTGTCTMGAIELQSLAADAVDQDFLALLFGDCTGNWVAPAPTPTPDPTQTPTVTHTLTAVPTATPANTATNTLVPTATASATPTNLPDELPTEPSGVAPPVDSGVASSIAEATDFLYTGPNPIQTGVAPATIDPKRVAVLRGLVQTHDSQPLPGVTITILNHPEFGQTLTRANGVFDLAVNGGGQLTVSYSLTGFLPAQRQIDAPWQDFAILPDVMLLPLDPQVTAVDLTANMPMQVARGSMVSDSDGSRQATVLFPQGATATIVFPNGSTQPITALNVRATEYTVGANGPNAMPAELPATSGYTYCVELSIDQAMAAGASDVRFSAPLPFYVENFLGFPIGMDVPLGSYDRSRGVWIPENNGRVIKLLSITGGMADLDTDGDGLADSPAMLAALSITDAERQQLATLYTAGQSIERMLITHFTPYDPNMPIMPPPDATFPPDDPEPDDPLDDPCMQSGNSVIECQNQILGEAIGVVGTGFGLHYESDRTRGYLAAYTLEIPISGATLPASIVGIELAIEVAGRRFESTFPAIPNQRTTFTWDGKDAYGRALDGPQPLTVDISYVYPAVYGRTTRFGAAASGVVTTVPSRQQVKLRRVTPLFIGTFHAPSAGLGGWSLSPHHAYVPNTQVLYRGDGRRESASATDATGPIVSAVTAVSGSCVGSANGIPASQAKVCPGGLAVGPDGSVYIVNAVGSDQRVRKVAPDGIISTVAGIGNFSQCFPATGPCGDGGPATQAQFVGVWSVAVGPDNSIFISDSGGHRVRKVDPTTGTITTVAGTGIACPSTASPCGDGGPGTLAQIENPAGLAVGPDNALYIADSFDNRIRRLGPDGIITTVAGSGSDCKNSASNTCGDGGPATQAGLSQPQSVAVGRDGSLYITEGNARVRRVTPDGIIRTIAGVFTGTQNGSPDGIPPTQAQIQPSAVAVGPDDKVYIADNLSGPRVRWFRPGGTINTLAGIQSVFGNTGDGGPARRATFGFFGGFVGFGIGPDGSLYLGDNSNQRVRRIAPIAERFVGSELVVPSVDGSEIFTFTPSGQHLRTLDPLTGALRYQFTYDALGQLATITDRSGNVTTVERDGQGKPMDILGPFGQRTLLDLDANGYLSKVTNPASEAVQLGYHPSGLLTSFMQPGGQTSTYNYDGIGRLISATDPDNKTKMLARTGTNKDHTITLTSPLGRVTTYRTTRLGNGDIRLTTTDSAGTQSQLLIGQNGSWSSTARDGTTSNATFDPDPRWGMRAPIPASLTTSTPGGRTHTATMQRTVTLASAGAFLNLSALTDTVTVNGRTFTTNYNDASRTVTATWPTGRQQKTVLDSRARVSQNQFGNLEPTLVGYDAQGRLATTSTGTGANTRTVTIAYDSAGFLKSVTNPIAHAVTLINDNAGRTTQVTRPGSDVVGIGYDANGNMVSLTPPGQPSHTFGYTARSELSRYTAPAVGTENRQSSVTYNADRQTTRFDHADGQASIFQYDSAGRLQLVDLTSGQRTYGYDSANRLTSIGTTQTVALTYAYDGVLLTDTTWSGTVAGRVTRTYDNDFRVSAFSVNSNNPIATQYDGDSFPIQVGNLVLTRNAQNGLITGTTLGGVSDTIGYDGFGIPATYAASYNGGAVYSATYSRDLVDRLTSRSETIGGTTHVFSYTYDLNGRLTEVRQDNVLTATYGYDPNGNRLSFTGSGGTITASYDARDRLIQYGATTYTYSPNGDLLSKMAGGQITTYDYDGSSTLKGVTLPAGARIDYLLDGRGRRVGRKVAGTLAQGFLYQDNLRPIAELDGAGAVVSRFVYANRSNVPAYMMRGGATYRIIADQLGSPRLVIDVATGQIVQRMDYDEFGRVLSDTNPGFQPFGFAGGLYDRDTQLVRFGARDYDAESGRWTSPDPIGFAGGDPDLYGYVFGDPINATDPLGLFCDSLFTCNFYDHQDNAYLEGKISREEYIENRTGEGVKQGAAAVLVVSLGVLGGEFLLSVAPETLSTSTAALVATRVGPFWGLGRLFGFLRKGAKAATCTKETTFAEEYGLTAGEEEYVNALTESGYEGFEASEVETLKSPQGTISRDFSRSNLRFDK
jgi:RHS repeat-associated protein